MAAALLVEPATAEEAARLLFGRWELAAPAHWKAEFSNVVWKAVRRDSLAAEKVDRLLTLAEALPIASIEVTALWRGAIARALAAGHPAYDALFVELAARLGTCVASYDRNLRARFPAHVRLPADLLAAGPRKGS